MNRKCNIICTIYLSMSRILNCHPLDSVIFNHGDKIPKSYASLTL